MQQPWLRRCARAATQGGSEMNVAGFSQQPYDQHFLSTASDVTRDEASPGIVAAQQVVA
jgi:hypothetical protein